MSAFGTSGHWRVDFAVLHKTAALQKRGLGGRSMRRREFTTLLAGAAVLVDYSEMDPFTDSPIRPTRQYAAWRRKAPLPTLGAEGAPKSTGYARLHGPRPIPDGIAITVPTGYSEFPREILRPPRSLAERVYTDIRRSSFMPRGGHFAAMEQPEPLAHELREFFRPLRASVGLS